MVCLGVHCCTVVTAVTAQNSLGVLDISYLSPEAVGKSITGAAAPLPITPLYFVQAYITRMNASLVIYAKTLQCSP